MDTSKVSSKWQVVIPRGVREAEQIRIDARAEFPDASLADLYDPLTTPPTLM